MAPFISMGQSDAYFQQQVDYKIEVSLDDVSHILNGRIEIDYKNNSTHSLNVIYMHLWPNAYKDNSTALVTQMLNNGDSKLFFAKEIERGFIDSLAFTVDGKSAALAYDLQNIDIGILTLPSKLAPGQTIKIASPFRVKIPASRFSRLGHNGQSYMITQWYPKPAVFDTDGWHSMPYLDQGEFYSEFGKFDVSITLPSNYVIAATGDLIENLFETNFKEEIIRKTTARETFDTDMSYPASSKQTKTVQFTQSNVHDFAWFADKRFHILKGEATLSESGKKVATFVYFLNKGSEYWSKSIEYMNDAVTYYSKWIGDYPYAHASAVQGEISAGGGMEYPNITVIGPMSSDYALETVLVHEVGHNWFYGILGSNERNHPWLDEGINSFYENRYMYSKYPDGKQAIEGLLGIAGPLGLRDLKHKDIADLAYLLSARTGKDQPIEEKSNLLSQINYGTITYSKTALVFDYLKSYLGDEVFDKCMQSYFTQWQYKHPSPHSLQTVFTECCNKDLSWFFNDLVNSTQRIDYKLKRVQNDESGKLLVTIKNKSKVESPFTLSGLNGNGSWVSIWNEGFSGTKKIYLTEGTYDYLMIDREKVMPEINRQNNFYRTTGILNKVEPLQIRIMGSVENPSKSQLFWFPLLGWNGNDRFMPGVALYNSLVPQKKFRYILAPMYGTLSNKPVGMGSVEYTVFSNSNSVRTVTPGVTFNSFTYQSQPFDLVYQKIMPRVKIDFRPENAQKPVRTSLTLRSVILDKEVAEYDRESKKFVKVTQQTITNIAQYSYGKSVRFNPYKISAKIEQGDKYAKASIESEFTMSFKNKVHGFDIRFFGGLFVWDDNAGPYRWRMSGWDGAADYLFDHVYLDRNATNGLGAQQFVQAEGGFKVPTFVGQADKWIAALNLKLSLPGPLPIRLYADVGTYNGAKDAFPGSQAVMYDAGVMLSSIHNVLELYVPIFRSSDIRDVHELNNIPFADLVRFQIRIEEMNPFKLLSTITR